ncbi:MAG: DUF3179 domain-containing protein, partial [Alphaproteobacteria bacterium]
ATMPSIVRHAIYFIVVGVAALRFIAFATAEVPTGWQQDWPRTDFSRATVPLAEIRSVIAKDGIPAVDHPVFVAAATALAQGIGTNDPVITLSIGGDSRAYPLRVLTWHEIVNDIIGDIPVAVTFCPLCNSAIAFDRRVKDRVLSFGTTGKLRNSDLVMYDRQTESWWQQFTGEGLVGILAGEKLVMVPVRVESLARFMQRHPAGKVLVPNERNIRDYGRNPYVGYDSSTKPFLFDGALPSGVPPLERVVVVDGTAWSFSLLSKQGRVEIGDLVITWEKGQASALDSEMIQDGRDVGNAVVQRRGPDGTLTDAVYDVSFAFAFHAFYPTGKIHHE